MNKPGVIYIGNLRSGKGHTPTNIDTLGPLLEVEGFQLFYASSRRNKLLRLLDMLGIIVAKRKSAKYVLIDTYSTAAFYFAYAASVLCRLFNLRYIPILHGGDLPSRLIRSPRLSSHLFSNSHANIAVSGYLRTAFLSHGFHVDVIPNNIDLKAYSYKKRTALAPSLLWVRAFHEIYNPGLAIQLVSLLAETYPEVRLTMVGPRKDDSLDSCKQLASSLGVSDKIHFAGLLSKEEWKDVSQHHDVFINTSNFDNLPVSVIEAMALGLPVVSTRVGGIPYLVNHNQTGLLVDAGNASAMKEAVCRLLKDTELAGAISAAARASVEQFDWGNLKPLWVRLLST